MRGLFTEEPKRADAQNSYRRASDDDGDLCIIRLTDDPAATASR